METSKQANSAPLPIAAAMRTLGLIGGMSWESTVTYYQTLNRRIGERLGGVHSAQLLLWSVDLGPLAPLQTQGEWSRIGSQLAGVAQRLERAGAEGLLLCTNTMHRVADQIEAAVEVPFLHIADATAEAIKAKGVRTVGLLGTRFTTEQAFYRQRLQELHGLEVLVPEAAQRELVHRVIYDELCRGKVLEPSRQSYIEIVQDLAARGAGGVILGCTEIGLLLQAEHAEVPLFDTARLHAEAAVRFALDGVLPSP